jgi:hypothetical protein
VDKGGCWNLSALEPTISNCHLRNVNFVYLDYESKRHVQWVSNYGIAVIH